MAGPSLRDQIESAQARFSKDIEAIAVQASAKIYPYLRKHRWTYIAGNGEWYIYDPSGVRIDDDDLPKWFKEMLWLEIGYGDYLGYYILPFPEAK